MWSQNALHVSLWGLGMPYGSVVWVSEWSVGQSVGSRNAPHVSRNALLVNSRCGSRDVTRGRCVCGGGEKLHCFCKATLAITRRRTAARREAPSGGWGAKGTFLLGGCGKKTNFPVFIFIDVKLFLHV